MTCYYPLQAFYGARRPNGKRCIVFKEDLREYGSPFMVPCGRCVGCRLERARQWGIRIMHEAQLYDNNCYLTLTYSDECLPIDKSLHPEHFLLFVRRLRRLARSSSFERDYPEYHRDNGIRYFHCGEYSPDKRRPHYHACIFNFDFPDRKFIKMSKGNKLYVSKMLDDLWGFGHCYIGNVTFDSANYVARYIIDKINGDRAFDHYTDKDTGVLLRPEYVTMSRRPGIGAEWLYKYYEDVYPSDEVIVHGKSVRPPKFYDSRVELHDPDFYADLKAKRSEEANKYSGDQSPERLEIREKVKLSKLGMFKRK